MKLRSIAIGLLVALALLGAPAAGAFIAHDATTNATPIAGTSSITFAHTTSGSLRCLVVKVGWRVVGGPGDPTATYNSVSMTRLRIDSGDGAAGPHSAIFYLVAPDTGSHNVVVTFSGNVTQGFASASSYTGVLQATPMDVAGGAGASNPSGSTSSTQSQSITTVTSGAVVIDAVAPQDQAPTMQAASQRTERSNQSSGSGHLATSDRGPIGTPGAVTMDWTTASAVKWAISLAALRPHPVAARRRVIEY